MQRQSGEPMTDLCCSIIVTKTAATNDVNMTIDLSRGGESIARSELSYPAEIATPGVSIADAVASAVTELEMEPFARYTSDAVG